MFEALPKILEECKRVFSLLKSNCSYKCTWWVSVTLMEGVTMAKSFKHFFESSINLQLITLKVLIFIHFLLKKDESLPMTILLVSGGHTQIIETNV